MIIKIKDIMMLSYTELKELIYKFVNGCDELALAQTRRLYRVEIGIQDHSVLEIFADCRFESSNLKVKFTSKKEQNICTLSKQIHSDDFIVLFYGLIHENRLTPNFDDDQTVVYRKKKTTIID